MPIYEYICSQCSERFSLLQSIHDQDETRCPRCKSRQVTKIVSPFCCSSSGENVSSPSPSYGAGGGG